ncbi:bolA-like protein 1 [Numida meleagris]|uniref:bolA-like protein 1 n=1 Tax=Numida meleagris TaxID=8996 RepID=UPI000B3E101F|nr:bolA-like protein 1 [Numida meleagris]
MPPPNLSALPPGPIARAIRSKLTAALQPTHLHLEDHSSRHGGPPGAETHFGVLVVSGRFEGLSPIERHRLVHAALRPELQGPLHALSIVARTPQQWERDPRLPQPPPCMGGSKREKSGAEGDAAAR